MIYQSGFIISEGIRERTGNTNVKVSVLDTSDLDSVREFVQEFKKTEKQLDVLVRTLNRGGSCDRKKM